MVVKRRLLLPALKTACSLVFLIQLNIPIHWKYYSSLSNLEENMPSMLVKTVSEKQGKINCIIKYALFLTALFNSTQGYVFASTQGNEKQKCKKHLLLFIGRTVYLLILFILSCEPLGLQSNYCWSSLMTLSGIISFNVSHLLWFRVMN